MKMKAGINSAALKQFFVDHGEKLGLLAAVVIAVYTVWCAVEVEPYKKTVADLQGSVTAAQTNLNTSEKRLDLAKAEIVLPSKSESFVTLINRELVNDLLPARFNGIEWNKPLFDTKQRRTEPTYLALRDLRVEFRYAAVDMKGGGNAEALPRPYGEEWIAVTALVPFEDQTTNFYRAFQKAVDQVTNATPDYVAYEIRRAEVKTLDPKEAVDWEKISPLKQDTAVAAEVAKWNGTGPEIPTKELTLPALTEPLPPLTNRDKNPSEYGSWCLHPGLEPAPAAAVGAAENVGAGGVLGAPIAPAQVAQNPGQATEKPRPKNLLFRFLDFDIQPGKQYRYQVRLVLKNPNYRLDQAHLEKPELGEGETRLTPWSEPSPAVGVPHLEWFFAAGLKGNGVGGDSEPEMTMGYKRWSPPHAAVVLVKFAEIMRGNRLDRTSTEIEFPTPGAAGTSKTTTAFASGGTLLDFSWERTEHRLAGPAIPGMPGSDKKVNRPAEALVLNARGELVICVQTMDQPLWDDIANVGPGGVSPRGGSASGGINAAVIAPPASSTTTPATTGTPAVPAPAATPSATAPKLQLKLD